MPGKKALTKHKVKAGAAAKALPRAHVYRCVNNSALNRRFEKISRRFELVASGVINRPASPKSAIQSSATAVLLRSRRDPVDPALFVLVKRMQHGAPGHKR